MNETESEFLLAELWRNSPGCDSCSKSDRLEGFKQMFMKVRQSRASEVVMH